MRLHLPEFALGAALLAVIRGVRFTRVADTPNRQGI